MTKAIITAWKLLTHRTKVVLGSLDQKMLTNMYSSRIISQAFFLIAADQGNFLRMRIQREIKRSTIKKALSKGLDSRVAPEEGSQAFNGLEPV